MVQEKCGPWLVEGWWPLARQWMDLTGTWQQEKAMSRDARMVLGGGALHRWPWRDRAWSETWSGEVRPAGSGPWSVYIEHETEPTSQSPFCSPQCDISFQHNTLP